jgi:hypothetical protein
MWSDKDKVWTHFRMDILSTSKEDGSFLANYLRYSGMQKLHTPTLEIVDLQRYKIISQQKKVGIALRERTDTPFVFVIGKN